MVEVLKKLFVNGSLNVDGNELCLSINNEEFAIEGETRLVYAMDLNDINNLEQFKAQLQQDYQELDKLSNNDKLDVAKDINDYITLTKHTLAQVIEICK